jgi:pseudaminic acid synthase
MSKPILPRGPEGRTLLIAEVSANHDQDLDHALHLVDIAADAGWDCLKLQTYDAASLTMPSDHPSMRVDKVWGKDTLWDLYQSAHMPMEFHEPLFAKARERGLIPFTSIFDPRDLDFLEKLDCPIYKIASFEMTFDDLLEAVGSTGKPIILSTGMASYDEVKHALEILDSVSAPEVTLLHCCSSYPAPFEEINLSAMVEMGRRFDRSVGFSDHTLGALAPIAASAMGAAAIEKHFTDDSTRLGPDHRFSATPDIMREIADGIRDIAILKGNAEKGTTPAEQANKSVARRSAFAVRNLPEGHTLQTSDYRFIRPSAGISPIDRHMLPGAILKCAVRKGHPICYQNIVATGLK